MPAGWSNLVLSRLTLRASALTSFPSLRPSNSGTALCANLPKLFPTLRGPPYSGPGASCASSGTGSVHAVGDVHPSDRQTHPRGPPAGPPRPRLHSRAWGLQARAWLFAHGRPHLLRLVLATSLSSCSSDPSKRETAEKGASTRQAAKKRGGEGAAITHETCWLERERVVAHQEEHQGQTAQV